MSKKNIAVLVSGGGTNLQSLIDCEKQGMFGESKITLVVASKPGVYALERAAKAGIEGVVVSPKDYPSRADFNKGLLDKVDSFNPDLIVLAGFLVVIPEEMIDAYENKIINIHPSLIPSFCGTGYYGLKVHEAALERGVKLTGATVHYVDKGTDTGPIIMQKAVEVKEGDTPKMLQQRVMEEAEWKILPAAINMIANEK